MPLKLDNISINSVIKIIDFTLGWFFMTKWYKKKFSISDKFKILVRLTLSKIDILDAGMCMCVFLWLICP